MLRALAGTATLGRFGRAWDQRVAVVGLVDGVFCGAFLKNGPDRMVFMVGKSRALLETSQDTTVERDYPRPALTADVVVLRFRGALEVLLIRRGQAPFAGSWALPGGFVEPNEPPAAAARRELDEETAIDALPLVEIGVFGEPARDPRGWVVSCAFLALAGPDIRARAGDDAADVGWHDVERLPPLAFDHRDIIGRARHRLAESAQHGTLPLKLLPPTFRSRQARALYIRIAGKPISPSQFKAWLRRREAVERVGPARFRARDALHPDWCR